MKRATGCVLLVMLVSSPALAVGPFALLAKDIVKSIVRNFVEGQVNQMLATAGPCGTSIAGMGALPGMLRGGAMPSLTGLAGSTMGGVPGVGGMPTMGGAMPPGMTKMMEKQMEQAQAAMAKENAGAGSGTQGNAAMPDVAAMMQGMQGQAPLSREEVDELATLMENMSKAAPSVTTKCKPGDMKLVLQTAVDSPMVGGVLRMMLGPMRDAQRQIDEARETFAKMPESERSEYVETMAAEYRGWDKQNKQAFLGMIETNFLGMPETMKTQLLARLK
jgi:hypothetical protein